MFSLLIPIGFNQIRGLTPRTYESYLILESRINLLFFFLSFFFQKKKGEKRGREAITVKKYLGESFIFWPFCWHSFGRAWESWYFWRNVIFLVSLLLHKHTRTSSVNPFSAHTRYCGGIAEIQIGLENFQNKSIEYCFISLSFLFYLFYIFFILFHVWQTRNCTIPVV